MLSKKIIEFSLLTLLKVLQVLMLFYLLKLISNQFGNLVLLEYAEVKRYSNIIGVLLLAGVGATLPVAFRKGELAVRQLYETLTNVLLISSVAIIIVWLMGLKLLACAVAIYLYTSLFSIELKSKGRLYSMSLSNMACGFFLPFILLQITFISSFYFEVWASILACFSLLKFHLLGNQIKFIFSSVKRVLPDLGVLFVPSITVLHLPGSDAGYFAMFLSMNSGLLIVVNSINNLMIKYAKSSMDFFSTKTRRYCVFMLISIFIGGLSYVIWPHFKGYYNLELSIVAYEGVVFASISILLSMRLLNRTYFDLAKNYRFLFREVLVVVVIYLATSQFFSAIFTYLFVLVLQNMLDLYKGRDSVV